MSSRYFIAFAVIVTHGTIFPVLGQSTVQRCDNGDSSISIGAEIQQLRLLLEALGEDNDKLKKQVQDLQTLQNASFQQLKSQIDVCGSVSQVWDCSEIKASGQTSSGVYQVYVRHQFDRFFANAFCDMENPNGPSLVFQRRKDGSVNFYRTWREYRDGFGDPNGEFWLGNEMLYLLTSKRNYKLRIDLEDFEGGKRYAEYARFSISSSADNYTLTVSDYSGNAGDCLNYHKGQQFTTKDADNDNNVDHNCATYYHSAWWYDSCYSSNLNGIYHRGNYSGHANTQEGIAWRYWYTDWYSLKATEMKLVPVA